MNKDFRISNLENCFYALFTLHVMKMNNITQCVMKTTVTFMSQGRKCKLYACPTCQVTVVVPKRAAQITQ